MQAVRDVQALRDAARQCDEADAMQAVRDVEALCDVAQQRDSADAMQLVRDNQALRDVAQQLDAADAMQRVGDEQALRDAAQRRANEHTMQVLRDDQALRDATRQKAMDALQAAVSAIGATTDVPATTNGGIDIIVPQTPEDLTDGALLERDGRDSMAQASGPFFAPPSVASSANATNHSKVPSCIDAEAS
jgi:hypothetical protein